MLENQDGQDSLDVTNNAMNIENRDKNLNESKKVSVFQSKNILINEKSSSAKYYYLYCSVLIVIFFLFYLNYLQTSTWYEDHQHYVNLRPIKICTDYMKKLEKCLNDTQNSAENLKKENGIYTYDTKTICKNENDKLQTCFDKVYSFSQKCQIYLNELYLCKNNTGSSFEKCISNNLKSCWKTYNEVNLTKVYDEL